MMDAADVVVKPLALSIIMHAAYLVDSGEPNCTTLLGSFSDEGSLVVSDGFINFIHPDCQTNPAGFDLSHYEAMLTVMLKNTPRVFIVGWGSTTLKPEALPEFAAWAVSQRASRFIKQKRLRAPIFLCVAPLTKTQKLSVRAFTVVDEAPVECRVHFSHFTPYSTNKRMDSSCILETCKQNLAEAIEIVQQLDLSKPADRAALRDLRKAISININADLPNVFAAHEEEETLYQCMRSLVDIEKLLYERFMARDSARKPGVNCAA